MSEVIAEAVHAEVFQAIIASQFNTEKKIQFSLLLLVLSIMHNASGFWFFFPVQCSLFGHSVENEYSLICLLCTMLSIVNICSFQSCLTLKGSTSYYAADTEGEKEKLLFRD